MATDNLDALNALRAEMRNGYAPGLSAERMKLTEVRITPGDRGAIADAAEAALLAQPNVGLYHQSGRIIQVVSDKISLADSTLDKRLDAEAPRLTKVTKHNILERFEASARFTKYNCAAEDWISANCPPYVAEAYMARDGGWKIPHLRGVVSAPTLRRDRTILDTPGYDAASGLLFLPNGAVFPPIPDAPTLDDARAALEVLKLPIAMVPFATPASLSVALSGFITAIVRRALPVAPMHAFTAPAPGSGKSMLVDIASIIATGERAAVITSGRGRDRDGEAEMEKRLHSSIMAGDAVLSLDNLSGPLGGEAICVITSQPKVKIRIFNTQDSPTVVVTTALFATGNNLVIEGDMTRRVMLGTINPNVERPELREFDFNPLVLAAEIRGELVVAILTILKAWVSAGMPRQATPLGGFEGWSRLVRDALIWAGEADPCEVMEEVRGADPVMSLVKAVMEAWASTLGSGEYTIRQVCEACHVKDVEGAYINRDLHDAIIEVTGDRDGQSINPLRLAGWVRRNKDCWANGRRFVVSRKNAAQTWWRLEGAVAPVGRPVGPGEEPVPFGLDDLG